MVFKAYSNHSILHFQKTVFVSVYCTTIYLALLQTPIYSKIGKLEFWDSISLLLHYSKWVCNTH